MADAQLPPPVTTAEVYLAAILAELRTISEKLDRLQPPAPPAGTVSLKEPRKR